MNKTKIVVLILISAILAGCRGCGKTPTRKDRMRHDVTTRGIIYVAADESYKYILEEEKFMFEYIYPKSEINILYSDEKTAFERALADSVRLVVASTADNNVMDEYLIKNKIKKRITCVGHDAIVVISNKKNKVKKLGVKHLSAIITGKITRWKQINDSLPNETIRIFYDSPRSGIARYMVQRFLNGKGAITGKGADSTMQLVQWVHDDEHALGLIGFNFVSDYHDPRTRTMSERVNVLAMSHSRDTNLFCLPSQSSVGDSSYPLTRKILIINKEAKTGLGTGFVSFIAGPKGQRIMLKAGIVPQWIPGRNIEIVKE
jgi:phosphate transport system substrate-binding protein